MRPPALVGKEAPLSYFVAIVGPDGKVLAREEFATAIPLKDKTAIISEELEPAIPLPGRPPRRFLHGLRRFGDLTRRAGRKSQAIMLRGSIGLALTIAAHGLG